MSRLTPRSLIPSATANDDDNERLRDAMDPTSLLETNMNANGAADDDDDGDWLDWKEGFMDVNVLPSLSEPYDGGAFDVIEPTPTAGSKRKRSRGSARKDANFDHSFDSPSSSRPTSPSQLNSSIDSLAPTRIRRQYTCEQCTFRTINPREFLYHRRDVHNAKIKIVECKCPTPLERAASI